jgi:ATP-dependent helicase/DNAse subunit B
MPETAERECEEIARRVLERAGAGMPFREMGVILRQPDQYEPLLEATFQRFGVPAHFYFSQPLAAHPAGRLLSGTVDALLGGWEHEQTLGLLRLIPTTGVSDALDAFEIKVLDALPGQGLDSLKTHTHNRRLQAVLQKLSQLDDWLNMRARPDEWAERLGRLAAIYRPAVIPDQVTPAETALYRSQAAGVEAFAGAMRSAAEWWTTASNSIGLAEFWRVAKTMVRLNSVTVANRARNVVHVISAYEARQWDLSAVFVCGLVEKQFPAQTPRDPFLQDAAMRDLERQGVRARTAEDKEDEERGLFEAVCARARDLVVLSYPRIDARGQKNLRSIFLKDFEIEPVHAAVRPALPEPVARWGQNSALLSSDVLDHITTAHTRLSVTSLESLLQCSFQFFSSRALKIQEMPERPEDRLNFLVQGNIIHAVLSEWFAERPPLRPLFDAVFARVCAENHVLPGFRKERQRRSLFLALLRFMADSKYPLQWPSRTEQAFEFAIDPTLTVKGKLDRIDDLGDGRGIVIDYKFSRAATQRAKVDDPTKLQGPLYAAAMQRFFGLEPVAMLYLSLKDEKLSYDGWGDVPGMQLEALPLTREWMDDAIRRVSEAMAAFRAGAIHPHPANIEHCRYCTYRDACRFEQPMAIPVSGA